MVKQKSVDSCWDGAEKVRDEERERKPARNVGASSF
jgi:hypothetical protein